MANFFARDENMSKERNYQVSRRNLSIESQRKKVKNEGMWRKRDWMIDARNEDELKSRADLSGWLSRRILDKFPRSP